jgi:hypothetical protein
MFQNRVEKCQDICKYQSEIVSKVETPRHSRKSGNLLPIVNN